MKVGFIGLGMMGSGISANLRKAGHAMVVHDARRASADTIIAAGRLYAETPDGLIPWGDRPAEIKRGVVARIPAAFVHLREAAE